MKLSKTDQLHIVQEYVTTNITQQDLAKKYNIGLARLKQIVKGNRRNRDLKSMIVRWREAATKETEGGQQLFHRSYKEYQYHENDDFWLEDKTHPLIER